MATKLVMRNNSGQSIGTIENGSVNGILNNLHSDHASFKPRVETVVGTSSVRVVFDVIKAKNMPIGNDITINLTAGCTIACE